MSSPYKSGRDEPVWSSVQWYRGYCLVSRCSCQRSPRISGQLPYIVTTSGHQARSDAVGSCTVTQSPQRAGGEGQDPAVCPGDALDDGQAKTNARVVGHSPFSSPLKRLGERGNQLSGEVLACVLDREQRTCGENAGRDPHVAPFRQVVNDRVVDEIRGQLQQKCVRAGGVDGVARGFDGDATFFREGEERFRSFFRDERQVDVLSGEGPSVRVAEHKERFSEADSPGIDGVEAVDEFAGVAVWVPAGHVEQGLRNRQWGSQFVGGVGGEPLLFADLGFEACEHGVEGVGEFAELVSAACELDSVGERSRCGSAGGVGDAGQRSEHAASEQPPAHEAEHQQERQDHKCCWKENIGAEVVEVEGTQKVRRTGNRPTVRSSAQEEHPHRSEQQGTREHEEASVAERELEANA